VQIIQIKYKPKSKINAKYKKIFQPSITKSKINKNKMKMKKIKNLEYYKYLKAKIVKNAKCLKKVKNKTGKIIK